MNKILKSILIITALIVGIKLVLTTGNVLQLIMDNETLISVTVAIVTGLFVLASGNDNDTEFRNILKVVFVISILIFACQLIGSLMEKGIQGLFK